MCWSRSSASEPGPGTRWRAVAAVAVCLVAAGCDGERSPAPPPARPEDDGLAAARRRMVRDLESAGIADRRVLEAMAVVPRHRFVPEDLRDRSYENCALPIAEGQTTSQPAVIARMLELLELDGDERVLEIGTGSGYQAALLGRLAHEVWSIEIRPALKASAEREVARLREEGLLRCERLSLVVGDGSRGWERAAPYDAIVVTAASTEEPDALVRQLRPGGRLVIPLGHRIQELAVIEKGEDGSIRRRTVDVVRFQHLEE